MVERRLIREQVFPKRPPVLQDSQRRAHAVDASVTQQCSQCGRASNTDADPFRQTVGPKSAQECDDGRGTEAELTDEYQLQSCSARRLDLGIACVIECTAGNSRVTFRLAIICAELFQFSMRKPAQVFLFRGVLSVAAAPSSGLDRSGRLAAPQNSVSAPK